MSTTLSLGDQYILFEALGMFKDALQLEINEEDTTEIDAYNLQQMLDRVVELRTLVNKEGYQLVHQEITE